MKEVSSANTGFSIGKHSFNATRSSISGLKKLPVSARPIVLKYAIEHETKAESLFEVIGRKPSNARVLLGELAGKSSELWANMIAFAGGAKGPWQHLQQLYISNLNSMSAFAVAEQLGLALGIPEILDITFPVIKQKSTDHLLLQECALEMCSISILYKKPF